MGLFTCFWLTKLRGNGSKTNPTQTKSSEAGFPTRSNKTHFDDPTRSGKPHLEDPSRSSKTNINDPNQSAKIHFDDPTLSDKTHFNDPTRLGKTHFDDQIIPADNTHFDDPTPSDKAHIDDPTRDRISGHLKIPLKEIKSVTNNFADENFIGEGFLGKIYQGQFPHERGAIDVAVRRLDHSFWLQELAFEKEISILSRLKHENMVSIVGFCYENNEMLIIYERVARGSLSIHLSDPKLTWMRRLQISVGVVRALSYLHSFGIIHHNINSDSILLDENWEAKVSGFEYSMTIPAGNLDLAYEKLGMGTYKSDVFSIGIVLFQLLYGRDAFFSEDGKCFQASTAIFHYENRNLHKLVDRDLYSQMDPQAFNLFLVTAYNCLNEHESPLTNMNQVLKGIEKALEVQQMHENNEQSIAAGEHTLSDHLELKEPSTVAVERTLSDSLKLKLKSLEHMRISLADIESATAKFSKGCIMTGGYGSVYTAELDHVDKTYCLALERESKHDVPKKRSTVAIKRIIDTGDMVAEQGFYAEIEILTICKHSNIITLVGFCDEGREMILIYEYACNGSLNYHLQKMSNNRNVRWAQRVKICLDVAMGLSFLHTMEGDKQEIVHRDIKSANILLGDNFEAKIGDFGLSTFLSVSEEHDTRYSSAIAGTPGYIDPQYSKDAKLRKESDVYSFGVVLFEILCGTVAYNQNYAKNNKGLALLAKQHFQKGTIMEMVDPKIKEEISKTIFTSVKGPNQESLETFAKIAYECLAEAQIDRPRMEAVVKELEKALFFEETRKDKFQIPIEDIKLATNNFSDANFIGSDELWRAYRGEVLHVNGHNATSIDVKRFSAGAETCNEFATELQVLTKHKHENVISLLGYCEEGGERIIVYEHVLNQSLNEYVNKASLTWEKRLKICIDIANGLDCLHGGSVTREAVIHRDIKSSSILLDGDMNAKIANFELSIIHPTDQETVLLDSIKGTKAYSDPEYMRTGLLSKESDIYSFGIVLFEILLQRLAYSFESEQENHHFGPLIKRLYKEGKLNEMVFEGTKEHIALQSVTIFKRIAIQCLRDKREERPTASELVIQLKQALEIQEKGMDIVRISFEDIKHATNNFTKCIGKAGHGFVYKGQLPHDNGFKIIAAKRWDGQADHEFYQELEILLKFKHKNIVVLEGYCDEMDERIIVYECASNGSLYRQLNNISLTWMKRLKISIDIASGLEFLHGGALRQEAVIHRDIRSNNILLSSDWKATITDFALSLISPNNQEFDYVIKEARIRAPGYIDPKKLETVRVCKATDIYSFGMVLFEILCGRSVWPTAANNHQHLGPLAKSYYEQNKLDELVFHGIKEQIVPQSLSTFANIAYDCIRDDLHQRPTASEVVVKLKEAMEFQVDSEMWEPKLPSDYKEIIQQSRTPGICDTRKKKDLYDMLRDGILIQKGKVWFLLDSNNKGNELISATLFTYQNQSSQKWRHNRKSRFQRVPLMTDISNLKIQAKIKTQFLTQSVIYGVYLVFKFVEPNKISSEPKYVNLKYKMKNKTLHAYFATWRKDKWMMIELHRFLNHKDDGDFEVLLESFSRCYCGSDAIYVEGIEFRAIDNVTHEEIEKSKDVQQIMRSNSKTEVQQFPAENDEIFGVSKKGSKPSEMNGKKHHMLSAKEALYDSSNVKLFKLKPSEQSRFGEVIEVLSQQVFRIKFKIQSHILSPDIDYRCYLVFKISEKCHGLHCPVKVRGVHRPVKVEDLHQHHASHKETKALYFRTPKAWNIHDICQVPKQREDGWMEVNVWEFNSKNQLRKDCIHSNLKLVSYEGTMSGLIVCGLEFRPV